MSALSPHFQPEPTERIRPPLRVETAKPPSAARVLSGRERQIAALVAQGLSNKEIARDLDISPWTVSAHLRRIFAKLDINKRIELCMILLLDK